MTIPANQWGSCAILWHFLWCLTVVITILSAIILVFPGQKRGEWQNFHFEPTTAVKIALAKACKLFVYYFILEYCTCNLKKQQKNNNNAGLLTKVRTEFIGGTTRLKAPRGKRVLFPSKPLHGRKTWRSTLQNTWFSRCTCKCGWYAIVGSSAKLILCSV